MTQIGWEKMYHANRSQNEVGVAMLSEEVGFRAKNNSGNKVHFIMKSSNQENIRVLTFIKLLTALQYTK